MTDILKTYLAPLTPERRAKLEQVIAAVRAAAPDAAESIEWKMPVFRLGDRYFAVASQKSYVSVYCCTDPEIAAALKAASPRGVKGGKACVNYPDGVAIPKAALAAAVKRVFAA